MEEGTQKYWLMKAEPESRVVKGRDVKFSIDDFESAGCTPWEGVRNYEARNLMKEMVVGDKILFYHSNCKNPGIAGFAEVSREAYPDYTAFDSAHPYFDQKSDKDDPRWFMVDATFVARARHFVPLSLLRHLASLSSAQLPDALRYVGGDGISAIKGVVSSSPHAIAAEFLTRASQSHASDRPRAPQRAEGVCTMLGRHPYHGRQSAAIYQPSDRNTFDAGEKDGVIVRLSGRRGAGSSALPQVLAE